MPRPTRRYRPFALRLERLEDRNAPATLTPAQVRHAYGFDQLIYSTNGQTTPADGRGQTIAIIDAYHDPRIYNDLDTFDNQFSINGKQSLLSQYGSAKSFLTVATAQPTPPTDRGWAGETALDVEWAHAIAPGAKILLVEAASGDINDLMDAVNWARQQPGVVAVSMSWGGNEFSGEKQFENVFTTPAGHPGVTFVSSAGDDGAATSWPAASPKVLSVGGTRLQLTATGDYAGESAWTAGGGGTSTVFGRPAFQAGLNVGGRGSPDVSYDADPASGYYVYNSYGGGWERIGGTSAGAPQWAGLVAVADQGRALFGRGALDGATQTLPAVYAMPGVDFHDVAGGSNGFKAAAGYDLATGRGTPYADRVIASLVNSAPTVATVQATVNSRAVGAVAAAVAGARLRLLAELAPTPAAVDLTLAARVDVVAPTATATGVVVDQPALTPLLRPAELPWWSHGAGANRIARLAQLPDVAADDAGTVIDPDPDVDYSDPTDE